MESITPPDDRTFRLLRGGALVLASGSTLVGAGMLEPDSRGYGTHEQLAIADSCTVCHAGECRGLVTSVVHAVRGNVSESLRAHGAGLPIVLALGWTFVMGIVELLPRPWLSFRARRNVALLLVVAIGIGAAVTVAERAWLSDVVGSR